MIVMNNVDSIMLQGVKLPKFHAGTFNGLIRSGGLSCLRFHFPGMLFMKLELVNQLILLYRVVTKGSEAKGEPF